MCVGVGVCVCVCVYLDFCTREQKQNKFREHDTDVFVHLESSLINREKTRGRLEIFLNHPTNIISS